MTKMIDYMRNPQGPTPKENFHFDHLGIPHGDDYRTKMISSLGAITRSRSPVYIDDWRHVSKDTKEQIFNELRVIIIIFGNSP